MLRRTFLAAFAAQQPTPPVRPITRGPRFHWFGYYDKLQFDPSSRYALGVEGSFEHRLPTADDSLRIGMVDTDDGDRWTDLGETHAWSWHQTSMLQWIPGSRDTVVWNDRQGSDLVCHIVNVRTGRRRTIGAPIYALAPDGKWAISTDFRRLFDVRPETGYAGAKDPYAGQLAPEKTGIWRVDLATGKQQLLISYAQAAAIANPHRDMSGAKHWFNHLLLAPDGKRFVFLHRWRGAAEGRSFSTRMFTADITGRDLRLLDPYGRTSHFIWRDARRLVAWTNWPDSGEGFYEFEDLPNGKVTPFYPKELTRNGHCTFLPGGRWFLSDTGPDKDRLQHPYLFRLEDRKHVPLGSYRTPPEYTGYWRCDTTPRHSPDGRKVIFDSPHGGNGRQMYLAEVGAVTG